MGHPLGRHRQRERQRRLRAARRRNPEVLVAAGHQHRRLEILPRHDRDGRTRAQRQAAHRPRRRRDHDVGARAEILCQRRRPAGFQRRSEAPAGLSEGRLQQPGLVQLRFREGAAMLGVLHQLGAGHDGIDPRPGEDRGDALQVRIRHRLEPLGDSIVAGTARRRGHGIGSGFVHEGVRRVRRRSSTRITQTSSNSSTARSTKRRKPGRSSMPVTTVPSRVRRIHPSSSRTPTTACA